MEKKVEFSPQQAAAFGGIQRWLADPSYPQVRHLAGFAGTGKTTVVAELLQTGLDVRFAAYTGQAARMLQRRGCLGATTIHKLIYQPREYWNSETQKYVTSFHPTDQGPFADLIVIDECSMVGEKMGQDLLNLGIRVLVVGDPAQLPPIEGGGFFTSRKPDWLLSEPHRQGAESGIFRLATQIRNGDGYSKAPGYYGPDVRIISRSECPELNSIGFLGSFDQIIVGTNAVRHVLNNEMRQALVPGVGPYPVRGEKLVCLRNNNKIGITNGSLWCTTSDARSAGRNAIIFDAEEFDDNNYIDTPPPALDTIHRVETWTHHIEHREHELAGQPYSYTSQYNAFDYGYAITAHKAQGSGFDRVLVWDESNSFRQNAQRWLYTAVTRAAKELVMITQ